MAKGRRQEHLDSQFSGGLEHHLMRRACPHETWWACSLEGGGAKKIGNFNVGDKKLARTRN
jgi:hypothetical protein